MENKNVEKKRIPVISALQDKWNAFRALDQRDKTRLIVDSLINNALIIIIVVFVVIVAIAKPLFLQNAPIDILKRTASSLILALGVAGIICLTGTDLSAGRILGFCACICASLLQKLPAATKMFPNLPVPPMVLVLLLVVVVGALFGLFNGFFTAKFSLHPFIVTLATSLILQGVVLEYLNLGQNGGLAISGLTDSYTNFITGNMLGWLNKILISFSLTPIKMAIPWYILYAVILTAVMWVIWNKTTLGKNMYAVGANPEAAKVSGVSVMGTTILLFVLAGVMYGIGGFVEAARIGANSASTGVGFELNAIAACVIGGVSFTGGVGKISGVVIGVIVLQVISVALQWLSVSATYTYIITGFIILFAVALDMRKYLAKK